MSDLSRYERAVAKRERRARKKGASNYARANVTPPAEVERVRANARRDDYQMARDERERRRLPRVRAALLRLFGKGGESC